MPKLFVYGSLRKGMSHHHYLKDQKFIGRARSALKFAVKMLTFEGIEGEYPIAQESGDGRPLDGEIYEINDDILQMLDEYEEYPELYDRRAFDFITDEGTTIEALMYCGHRR